MAYVTPKENWTSDSAPLPSDLNRIEANTHANHDAIVQEAADRAAAVSAEAVARAADVDSEEAARIAAVSAEATSRGSADTTLQNNINVEAVARANADAAIYTSLFTLGAVGSYAFLYNFSGSNISHGGTVSGGSMQYGGVKSTGPYRAGTSPSGTWRCMGECEADAVSLFVRIS